MESARTGRHFSMVRGYSLADLVTLGNASCGFIAILVAMSYVDEPAPWKIPVAIAALFLALFADGLDGLAARARGTSSPMGRELDSLSDVISFGVAPAVLGWALGLRGLGDMAVLVAFVAAGVSRLARYNVTAEGLSGPTGKVRYFEGTPITFSVLIVITLAVCALTGHVGAGLPGGVVGAGALSFHPAVAVYAALACTMVSRTLRIPKP